MARGNQTFKKRQRENKLREKAQLKRERRQERRVEKKKALEGGAEPFTFEEIASEEESLGDHDFAAEREG
jgi:hypothetical protein